MLNIGTPDRIIRVILGAALITLPFLNLPLFANPILWWGAIAIGAILVATATMAICPIYHALGIRTRPRP